MLCCSPGPLKYVQIVAHTRAKRPACRYLGRLLLPMMSCLVFALPACGQDSGTLDKELFGSGAEITVTVHDSSGEPISSTAIVKLLRGGAIPSRQAETSQGRAELVVNNLGEFTVIVEAAGYERAQKELSVLANGKTYVDIYLRRSLPAGNSMVAPGRPLLSPKAKEALDKGLQALKAANLRDAEKYMNEAMRLAPGHPDVLYVQGVLWMQERKWPEAQGVLERATQIDQNNARAFAALGMTLSDQGKFEAAIAPLERSLQLYATGTWETRWALANAYYKHEQYDDALKISQQALADSNGNAPQIALIVAQSLTAVGRYDDAAQVLRTFLKDHADRQEAATAQRWLNQLTISGKIQAN